MKKFFRIFGGSILVLFFLVISLFFLHPRIPLGILCGPVSSLLTFFTGTEQEIRGGYFIVPGSWTTLSMEKGTVHLTGKEGFKLKTLINSAQTTVHLWSLFTGKIKLDGITLQGMDIALQSGKAKEKSAPTIKKEHNNRSDLLPFILLQTGAIALSDIDVAIASPAAGNPITFQLVKGTGAFSQNDPGKCSIEALIDDKAFTADLETGPLADMSTLSSDWPFALHINHKSVAAEITGLVQKGKDGHQITAEISLAGDHLDDLFSVAGLHGSKNQSFLLRGDLTLSRQEILGNFSKVRMGEENFVFSASIEQWDTPEPIYKLKMKDDLLDLDILKGFLSPENKQAEVPEHEKNETGINRDDVIFPASFPLKNLVLDLDLKKLVMAGKLAKNVRLNAVMVNGVIDASPFAVTFGRTDLSGNFSLNVAETVPSLSVHYVTTFFDIGSFLKELQLTDEIDMQVEKAATDLKTSGRTLRELFNNFSFTITAHDGMFAYRDPNTEAVLPLNLTNIIISGVPGEQITATIEGNLGNSPISILTEIDDRRDEPPESVRDFGVKQQIRVADTELDLSGTIPLPFKLAGTKLHSRFTGERLNSLNELLHVKLPEIGPFEAKGSLSIVPQGYSLSGILLQVGSSLLEGEVTIDTSTTPLEVDVGLEAQQIQLDDFKAVQLKQGQDNASDQEQKKEVKTATEEKEKSLTDKALLTMYNASIVLEVKEILSGPDHLGSGTLKIVQKDGGLRIDPLQIEIPGGIVNIDFSDYPSGQDRFYTMHVIIEDFDYGFLARRFTPDTDMSGIINLRASLESTSPNSQEIMANGYGYLDFSVQPRQLRAGVIDLWAVNIFSYLVPFLVPKGESKINCAAGRFNLEDGILKQDEFLIDTTKIRVKGTAEVDFKKQKIDAVLRPVPKRPQFYSLSTPIEIDGSFSDLDAGLAAGGAIGTIIRLATSYIVVPLQWIVQNKLPEDGTADCLLLIEDRNE